MSNPDHTQSTAADNQAATHQEQPFTLADAGSLLHQHVFGSGDPTWATSQQYSAHCRTLDSLTELRRDLALLGEGMELLRLSLMHGQFALDIQEAHGRRIAGVLLPMQREIERHTATLQAALGERAE